LANPINSAGMTLPWCINW